MSDHHFSALIVAVRAKNKEECRRLIEEEGANVNDKTNDGRSSLMWACYCGYLDIAEFLVSKGASIYDVSNDGRRCLIWACYWGRLDIAEFLVSKGASINDKTNNYSRCLMQACFNGHLDVAEFLLTKGANIHGINNEGNTCFAIALHDHHINILYRLRKWPTTMAIIMLQELALIYIIDSESVIDLHQYLGRPDDCSKSDNEEDYGDLNELFPRT
jgi:ankyrin repeat protein